MPLRPRKVSLSLNKTRPVILVSTIQHSEWLKDADFRIWSKSLGLVSLAVIKAQNLILLYM